MSERVRRYFEQRRQAAEGRQVGDGTRMPSVHSPEPEAEQAFAKSLFFADAIGLPARADAPSSSKPPQRIERFFQRRRDAEEGTWSPLPSMTLSTHIRAPQLLAPVPRHGAPLVVQDEPDIVWNRPKIVKQTRSACEITQREEQFALLMQVAAGAMIIVGLSLLLFGQEYGPPVIWGGMLTFACSFVRERPSTPVLAPKKPPLSVPFQLSWSTTYSPEQLGLGAVNSSHYEPA